MLVPGGSPLPTLRVLPQGISRKRLEQAVRDLQLPVVIARDVDEADVVMTLRNEYKQKTPMLRDAEDRAVPIYVLKSNTIPQMQSSLTSIFSLEIDPREAAMRETEDAIESVLSSSEASRVVAPERVHPPTPAPDGGAGQPRVTVARPRAVPAGPPLSGRGPNRLAMTGWSGGGSGEEASGRRVGRGGGGRGPVGTGPGRWDSGGGAATGRARSRPRTFEAQASEPGGVVAIPGHGFAVVRGLIGSPDGHRAARTGHRLRRP